MIQVSKKIRHIIMRMMYLKTSSPPENISQNYNTIGGRKSQEIRAFTGISARFYHLLRILKIGHTGG